MRFNQDGTIFTRNDGCLKLVNKITYPGSSVSFPENDINTYVAKAWTAIDRLSIMWDSDISDKLQRDIFQEAAVLIQLYGCTTRTLTKRIERKLHGNYTRMLLAILNKSWKQHPTKQPLFSHLPPICKTTQIRRTGKQGRTIMWRFSRNAFTWTCQWYSKSK